MMNALNMFMLSMKLKFQQFCTKENGDVNIVSIVVLIGIAVLLAIVFKDAISGLINDLLETITSNATDAVNTPAN
jgi:ABC-type lipoprotein release transport system permease subunit